MYIDLDEDGTYKTYDEVFTRSDNYGKIVDGYINQLNPRFGISIDKYVIMPNHINLTIKIDNGTCAR